MNSSLALRVATAAAGALAIAGGLVAPAFAATSYSYYNSTTCLNVQNSNRILSEWNMLNPYTGYSSPTCANPYSTGYNSYPGYSYNQYPYNNYNSNYNGGGNYGYMYPYGSSSYSNTNPNVRYGYGPYNNTYYTQPYSTYQEPYQPYGYNASYNNQSGYGYQYQYGYGYSY